MFCVAYLVYTLIAQLGVIACIVGIFITTPVMFAAMGVAYRDVFSLAGAAARPAPAAPQAPTAEPPKAEGPSAPEAPEAPTQDETETPPESGWEDTSAESEGEEAPDEGEDSDWS